MKLPCLFFLLIAVTAKGQTTVPCACKAFIDLTVNESLKVVDKPNGKLVKLLKYNPSDDDFLKVNIDKVSDSFFHAKLQYDGSGQTFTGWFLKKKYIVTFVKNYSAAVKLYALPNSIASVSATIAAGTSNLFEIQNCKDKWLFIKTQSKNKSSVKEGWLDSRNQCANPFTTCN